MSLLLEYEAFAEVLREFADTPQSRIDEVTRQIENSGYYELTPEELCYGAKLAWRNHARCNGRMHWRTLRISDFRDAKTSDDVFEGCLDHLSYSTNGGAVRTLLTVFPQEQHGQGFEVLNPQLIRYAGYRNADGSVLGDPLHIGLTNHALSLGWSPPHTAFDVLPLLIKDPAGTVSMYEIPARYVLEVPISHPDYPGIGALGLKWHANPAVSDKILCIGGLSFRAAPFTGWYVSSEIGARNLGDADRYNMLSQIAAAMSLDVGKDSTLWKDRAVIELTYAVQWSYAAAGVHIIDHHTAAKQFVAHIEREKSNQRRTPTDWSWINPPISASTTPTFHRRYDAADFDLRPNFVAKNDAALAPQCPVRD